MNTELAQVITVLARAQQDAVWNRQQVVNQLRSHLREYYPAALLAFQHQANGGLTRAGARTILAVAPTPSHAAKITRSQLRAALKRSGRTRDFDTAIDRIQAALSSLRASRRPANTHYRRRRAHGDGHAQAQGHLFNKFLGQLPHCLHTNQLYNEAQAFGPPLAVAA